MVDLNRLFMLLNLETSQFTEFKFQQRLICSETPVTSIYSFVESLVLLDETINPYCSSGTATFILDRYYLLYYKTMFCFRSFSLICLLLQSFYAKR